MGSFIDEYVSIVSQITDSPPLFIQASAYWLTSLLFGVNVICPFGTPGTKRVNIWFLLSGPAGITRKSTVISGLAKHFFCLLFSKYLSSKLNIDEKEAWKISMMVFIEKATPEGLADHFQLTSNLTGNDSGLDRYSLLTTEFGGILKIAQKDYMSGYIELLSKLYYGESDVYYLSSKKRKPEERVRFIPEGLYVCALVGVQKLNLYVKPEIVTQGLLRRFVVIHQDIDDKVVKLPPLDPTRQALYAELFDDMVSRYIDMVHNYNQFDIQSQRPLQVFTRIKPDVMNKINFYCQKWEDEYAQNTEDIWLRYKQSAWEHLLKLTILQSISRTPNPKYRLGDLEIEVTIDDFNKAFDFLTKTHKKAMVEISAIAAQPVEIGLPLSTGKLNYIYNIIENAGQEGISRSELLIKSGLLKDELKRLVLTLMEQGRVVAYRYDVPGGGRPQIRFYTSDYLKYLASSGLTPISIDMLDTIWR